MCAIEVQSNQQKVYLSITQCVRSISFHFIFLMCRHKWAHSDSWSLHFFLSWSLSLIFSLCLYVSFEWDKEEREPLLLPTMISFVCVFSIASHSIALFYVCCRTLKCVIINTHGPNEIETNPPRSINYKSVLNRGRHQHFIRNILLK